MLTHNLGQGDFQKGGEHCVRALMSRCHARSQLTGEETALRGSVTLPMAGRSWESQWDSLAPDLVL